MPGDVTEGSGQARHELFAFWVVAVVRGLEARVMPDRFHRVEFRTVSRERHHLEPAMPSNQPWTSGAR